MYCIIFLLTQASELEGGYGREEGWVPPRTFCAKLYITITKVKSLATPSNFQFAPNDTDSCICINIKLSLHQILDFSASFKHYELKKSLNKKH